MLQYAGGVGAFSVEKGELSPQTTEKKRRLTHVERKEELEKEIELLESGVAVLKTRGLAPQLMLENDPVLRPMAEERGALMYAMQTQQLYVAKMQSALSQCFMDQQYFPLYSRICLGKDTKERRVALLAMREEKLRNVVEFIMAPERLGDPLKPHFSENRFETAEGDLCCVRYETVQFPGVESLDQVIEALSFYKTNMEFILSEQLGHITLRDDYDAVDGSAFNTRMLSTDQNGITSEGNVVSFRHIFGTDEENYVGEPCAIMAADTVDEDELYPYLSSERVRRDISSGFVLTMTRRPFQGELVVTMRRATFLKVRRPEFPLSAHTYEDVRDGLMQCHDVMAKTVRGILYPKN